MNIRICELETKWNHRYLIFRKVGKFTLNCELNSLTYLGFGPDICNFAENLPASPQTDLIKDIAKFGLENDQENLYKSLLDLIEYLKS